MWLTVRPLTYIVDNLRSQHIKHMELMDLIGVSRFLVNLVTNSCFCVFLYCWQSVGFRILIFFDMVSALAGDLSMTF